jgi:hypothetical protein
MTEHKAAWELLPDIAAGTYENDDLAKVEAHLADCPICRVELDSLRDTVQLLTGAPELLEPPAGLRERVLAAARESNEAAASAPEPARSSPRKLRWSERRWWPVGLASAAALGAVIVGIVVSQNSSTGQPLSLMPPPHTASNAWGKASWGTPSNGNVPITLKVGELPKPTNGFYEVWFGKGKDQRHSVGTFTVDSAGTANVTFDVPQGVSSEYRWIWVTREKDDGNAQPSRDTVLFADL